MDKVLSGGPAEKVEIEQRSVIVKSGGKEIATSKDLPPMNSTDTKPASDRGLNPDFHTSGQLVFHPHDDRVDSFNTDQSIIKISLRQL